MDISCIILAGGKSTRLGRNKLLERIEGKTLFARVVTTLSLFNSEIIVVTSEQLNIPQEIRYPEIKTVHDILPGKGSLGGIYTGLIASKTLYNIVVACDMPFLNYNLLRYFVEVADGFDLVVFNNGDNIEPLHAIYSQKCIPIMERLLHRFPVRIIEILPYIKYRNLNQEEIDKIDQYHLSFFNINTESDLEIAKSLSEKPVFV